MGLTDIVSSLVIFQILWLAVGHKKAKTLLIH